MVAGASGVVIDNFTVGIDPAHPRAGVHAVQVLTCFVRGTVRINGAFWSACNVRVAKVFGNTLACGGPGSTVADRIRAARRRVAWVYYFSGCWGCK